MVEASDDGSPDPAHARPEENARNPAASSAPADAEGDKAFEWLLQRQIEVEMSLRGCVLASQADVIRVGNTFATFVEFSPRSTNPQPCSATKPADARALPQNSFKSSSTASPGSTRGSPWTNSVEMETCPCTRRRCSIDETECAKPSPTRTRPSGRNASPGSSRACERCVCCSASRWRTRMTCEWRREAVTGANDFFRSLASTRGGQKRGGLRRARGAEERVMRILAGPRANHRSRFHGTRTVASRCGFEAKDTSRRDARRGAQSSSSVGVTARGFLRPRAGATLACSSFFCALLAREILHTGHARAARVGPPPRRSQCRSTTPPPSVSTR